MTPATSPAKDTGSGEPYQSEIGQGVEPFQINDGMQARASPGPTRLSYTQNQSLIYCLPPEILTRVFFMLQHKFFPKPSIAWIVVTHVSQYWRNVALGSGVLWSAIRSDNPAVDVWLQRSGSTRLSVDLTARDFPHLVIIRRVLRELPRIRWLYIELPDALWDEISSELSHQAPVLESLVVRTRYDRDRSDVDIEIPPSIFSRHQFLAACQHRIVYSPPILPFLQG